VVTGKAFVVGPERKVFIAAKMIGTETGAIDGVTLQASRDVDPGDLLGQLSVKVSELLRAAGPKLLGDKDALADPLPGLKARLAGRPLPKVAVAVAKRTGGPAAAGPTDPAIGAEIRDVLKGAGFTVVDAAEGEWDKAGVEVVVTCDGASDPGGRVGSLVTCTARVDVKAVTRKDGHTFYTEEASTAAADVGEQPAGKAALRKGGREAGISLLQHFADTLPPAAGAGEKAAGAAGTPDATPK
jgi:hypothetical protein